MAKYVSWWKRAAPTYAVRTVDAAKENLTPHQVLSRMVLASGCVCASVAAEGPAIGLRRTDEIAGRLAALKEERATAPLSREEMLAVTYITAVGDTIGDYNPELTYNQGGRPELRADSGAQGARGTRRTPNDLPGRRLASGRRSTNIASSDGLYRVTPGTASSHSMRIEAPYRAELAGAGGRLGARLSRGSGWTHGQKPERRRCTAAASGTRTGRCHRDMFAPDTGTVGSVSRAH